MWTSSISLLLLSLLLPVALTLFSNLALVRAQDDLIDCPDSSLEAYLISLIDVLYWNGLTTSEELLVSISEIDEGYSLLESLYNQSQSSTYTFLAPTDSAWQEVNISPPFNGLTNQTLVELFAIHLLQGDWEPTTISQGDNVASTFLSMGYEMDLQASDLSSDANGTSGSGSGSGSGAMQAVVLRQSQDGSSLIAQNEWSNATSWSGKVDTTTQDLLSNVVILPIDTVLTIPPNLTTALADYALTNISSALNIIDAQDQIEGLSQGGFTIFAPIDQAFTSDITSLLSDDPTAQSIIGNLYTTNYTLYSPQWSSSSEGEEGFSISTNSGDQLTVLTNTSGSFVSLTSAASSTNTTDGDGDAANGTSVNWGTVLQSDITVENGVMHIIDTVLVSSTSNSTTSTNSTTNNTASTPTSTKASGGSLATSATSATSSGSGNTIVVTSGANARTSLHGVSHVEQRPLVVFVRSTIIGMLGYLMIASVGI